MMVNTALTCIYAIVWCWDRMPTKAPIGKSRRASYTKVSEKSWITKMFRFYFEKILSSKDRKICWTLLRAAKAFTMLWTDICIWSKTNRNLFHLTIKWAYLLLKNILAKICVCLPVFLHLYFYLSIDIHCLGFQKKSCCAAQADSNSQSCFSLTGNGIARVQ